VVFKKRYLEKIGNFCRYSCQGNANNEDFGHMSILREYSGVPHRTKNLGRLQHGWILFPKLEFWPNGIFRTYVWTKKLELQATEKGWQDFKAIGSPWIYLQKIRVRNGWDQMDDLVPKTIQELWVFGGHSIGISARSDEDLIFFLNAASASPKKSKLVLLYETDFRNYLRLKENLEIDLLVITMGPRQNSVFSDVYLLELYELLLSVESIVTEWPSTLVLYSLSLGVNVVWLQGPSLIEARKLCGQYGDENTIKLISADRLDGTENKNLALFELGIESILTPDELTRVMIWKYSEFDIIFNLFLTLKRSFANNKFHLPKVFRKH
jgi:hypothetical protein